MDSRLPGELHTLFESGTFLLHKAGILAAVLLFFLTVNALNVFFGKRLPPSRVKATIKAALLGFLLILLGTQLRFAPPFDNVLAIAVNLLVMLCLANFAAYLFVDIYLTRRMTGIVPSYKRDLSAALVYIAFAMASLRFIFRIDLAAILTTTTVLTAAVAFAMQTTLANIVSSFYVQNDENLRRNTWVSLPGHDITGEIINVGFRYTTLRTLENHKVMVPNSHIMQNVVRTLGVRGGAEKTAANLKVGLGYDLPPGKAIDMMTRILEGEQHIVREPGPSVVVGAFLDSSIEYDLKYSLDDYSSARETRGNVLGRIWYAVAREGYSIPYPHREVIGKSPRDPFPADRGAVLAALRRTDILRSLGEEEFLRLSECVHERVFGAGESVVRQGADGDSLFIVRRGSLDVRIDGVPVGNLQEGDVFGEMSLLTGEKRKATVTAAGEVHLVEISKADIEPAIRARPELLEKLSVILARREEINAERRRAAGLQQAETSGKDVFLAKLKAFFGFTAD